MAKVLRHTTAIVIDEAPITHKSVYEEMDLTLQNLMRIKQPMGDIPTVLCGNFKQIDKEFIPIHFCLVMDQVLVLCHVFLKGHEIKSK